MTSQSAENFSNQNDPSNAGKAATPSRDEILGKPADERLAWFASLTYEHPRLMTVIGHLQELMDPNNDIKIIALIGPTGIGKTTLIDRCLLSIIQRYAPVRLPHEVPVAVVAAPANGERSFSWRTMYRRLQAASGGVLIDQQRLSVVSAAELGAIRADRVGLAQRRELLEAEVRHRRVRLLGIDESHHLLRFSESEATMDTLKSLADIQRETKLMLAGTYQIAPLLSAYGQLARRGAILHYSRYKLSDAPKDDAPTKDEQAFREVLAKIANDWPCEHVPNLEATWQTLMRASLGSVGLLKMQLQQLALLQTKRKGEQFNAKDALRAFKASKTLNQIEREILDGEEELKGACYGDADFGTEAEQKEWLETLGSVVRKATATEARLPLPAPVVLVTPMYGIPPRGLGTGDIESLFSHLLALSHAQRLAPRQVVSRVLPEVERRLDGMHLRQRYQIAWAWDKHAGKEMIGMSGATKRWVNVLEAATGLTGLRAATLLPLEALTTGNLISHEERVCIDCLMDDVSTAGLPYERLLWRLRPVTCCPIHRKRLLVPQCGRSAGPALSEFGRVKLSGVCRTCGSIGHTCRSNQPEPAADDEVWRADQCRRVIAAMPSIEQAGPAPVRAAIRAHCAQRGAVSSLAFRSGAPKSVLTQWLKHEEWRLGFEQLLDICAVEELELAALLQGHIQPAPEASGLEPARTKGRRDRVDHDAIRRALSVALNDGRSVTDVAKELRVDLSTLAKHRDLYVPVRQATARRKAEQEEVRHLTAIKKVEAMALNVVKRGKRLTHRNALREGSGGFSPSSVESAVFSVMRMALGDRSALGPATARKLGPRYLQRISEAAAKLRPDIGEGQMTFPFAPD